jgi:heptosyltransferase III
MFFPDKNVAKTALRAGIPIRIGTSHRLYHWLYCNKLPSFSRKNSELHEAQLNLKLLKPFGIDTIQTVEQLSQLPLFNKIPEPDEMTRSLIDYNRINVIFHPHSKGSAREWPIDHYIELCNLLSHDTYHIIFCGTQSEAQLYKPFLKKIHRPFSDAGGTLSLSQYISLISKCQALVAASTGPLHIAAATGIHAFGIYPPIRPMHAGRWAPLGKHIHILTKENSCSLCRKSTHCQCMEDILPEMVKSEIEHAFAQ